MAQSNTVTKTNTKIKILLLSGPSGTGKTTVANEISAQLCHNNVPHVCIDGDNLDYIYPEEEDAEILLRNLEAMWSTYYSCRRESCGYLIMPGTAMVLEREGIKGTIEKVIQRLSREEGESKADVEVVMSCVILRASGEVVAERLGRREIGSTLSKHLESSLRMAAVFEEMVDEDTAMRVEAGGNNVPGLAQEILKRVQWLQ